jgi:hypothetical protein
LTGELPSAFITKMSPLLVRSTSWACWSRLRKAILVPSGAQAGSMASIGRGSLT